MLISKNRWSKLTEQEKIWLQDAVDKSVHYQRKLWTQSENDALDSLKAAGVNIIYPDKAPFAERVLGMYDEFDDNKKVKDLIEAIKKLKPEAKMP
jgi:TRAP-type C4-dicarboxylate transport system substrate-binding protein